MANLPYPVLNLRKWELMGLRTNGSKTTLKGRTQKVDINGNLSEEQELNISVIQGSTLGPILFLLYYAMVHSHISYCLNVYGNANTTNLQRQRVKKKESIRVINNAGYRDHTASLFKLNCILPLDEMIKFSNLLFMHRYSNLNLPL